jgi:hypothetical protein
MAITALSEIRNVIKREQKLTLDRATLGQAGADLFTELFNREKEFQLTGCDVAEPDGPDHLKVSGTFRRPSSLDNVNVEFILFDRPSLGEPAERHGVFCVDIFNIPAVVSSLDCDGISYPDFGPEFPWAQIREGVNFSIDVHALPIPTLPNGRLPPMRHGRIRADSGVSYLDLRADIEGTAIGPSSLSLKPREIGVALPLSANDAIGPQIFLTGAITFGSGELEAKAEFLPHQHELRLSIGKFPTLEEVINFFLSAGGTSTHFPDALSTILGVQLTELRIFVDLADNTISEVEFKIATREKRITLLQDILDFTPSLEMQIYAPFEESFRSVEGVLAGDWEFGGARLRTELYFPSLDFSVEMISPLSFGSLIEKLTKKTQEDLGVTDAVWKIQLKEMALEGNFSGRRFAAEVALGNEAWTFKVANNEFALTGITISVAYAAKLDHVGMSASFKLAGVDVFVSGEWNDGGGWTFAGSTGYGQQIKLGKLAAEIKGWTPPKAVESFTIKNLAVSFATKEKENHFSFTCEGSLEVTPDKLLSGTILIDRDSKGFRAFGTLIFDGNRFSADLTAADQTQRLKLDWIKESEADFLNSLGQQYGGSPALTKQLSSLSLPKPVSAALVLDLADDRKSLALNCEVEFGKRKGALAILVAKDTRDKSKPDQWVFAAGVRVPDLSTKDLKDLGPLGSALQPYEIALNGLRIVAANATGDRLLIDGKPFEKGLLLKGQLAFRKSNEQALFEKDFECLLFGERDAAPPPAAAGSPATAQPRAKRESPAGTEAANNVAVGRTFGPFTFRKARFEYREPRIYLMLDASLGAGGIGLDLYGCNLNFPSELIMNADKFGELKIGLDGLGIGYDKPPLTIAGGLMRVASQYEVPVRLPEGITRKNGYAYQGDLLIQASKFQIAVLGAYETFDEIFEDKSSKTITSLFAFGMFSGILGGPPAFFVTGLALGGGYNSRLTIPPVQEIAEFPLIAAVMTPGKFKDSRDKLKTRIEASPGDYWFAAGVKFTSFKMAESFALFSVAFGNRLQFALTGLTKLQLPPPEAGSKYVAVSAELAIRAVLDPGAGVLSLEGRLTNNSYIFSEKLRLSGGFAFFIWFGSSPHAGDFVISLGGYHPLFVPPAHYPVVPRLAIRGQLDKLSVAGEIYLAITPSCVMGGVRFAAVFEGDGLRAAFLAYADFLMVWAPFHYDARIAIALSIRYQPFGNDASGGGCTIKIELGANLQLRGPPLAGIATVTYWVFSFTIRFGAQEDLTPPPLTWPEFQTRFLPPAATGGKAETALGTIRLTEGILREVKDDAGNTKYRVVNPYELMIETDSVVPCSTVSVGGTPLTGLPARPVGIRPMAATELVSTHKVDILKKTGREPGAVSAKFKSVGRPTKNFPEALWSPQAATDAPPTADRMMIENVPSGVVLRVAPTNPEHSLGPFDTKLFQYDRFSKNIVLNDDRLPPGRKIGSGVDFVKELKALSDSKERRKTIRDRLVAAMPTRVPPWNDIELSKTPANPREQFQALPRCSTLGSRL